MPSNVHPRIAPLPRSALQRSLIAALLLLACALAAAQAPPDYPRIVEREGLIMKVHHPVVDRWPDYAFLEAWIPVEVAGPDADPWIGAVRARVETEIDLEARLVRLLGRAVVAVRFADPATPDAVRSLAADAVLGERQTVLLDEVLLALADDFEPPMPVNDGAGFNRRPPRIVVRDSPVRLLLIDEQPVRAPIPGTALEVVVNTNRDLFFHSGDKLWYLVDDGAWQTQSLLASGAWNTTTDLPADFQALAAGDRWPGVRAALPARRPAVEPPPLLVSLEATELIVIDGTPVLQPVPGTGGLAVVANTERDLFRLGERWYFLAAGRWFSAERLDGDWTAADELPDAFARIPPDHGRAHVRRSVPGTRESALAYLEATLPQARVVAADGAPGETVTYAGAPRFEPIEGTELERAVNTAFAVIRHNNAYYLNHEAAWYRAENPEGPWRATLVVPEEIYAIPPSDPLYPVTFVRPAGNQPRAGEARFTYTEGYNGMYTIGRRAVTGTGWSYSPWSGHAAGSPVYRGYPHTYGWPHYGAGRWGPWGYGPGAGYLPPRTVDIETEPRGVGGRPAEVSEQDPGVARRGYDYTTLAQQRSDDTRSPYLADDFFADPEGRVYRRSEEGWDRHGEAGWSTMAELERQYGVRNVEPQAPAPPQRQAYRQNQEDIERMERYYDRRAKSYHLHSQLYVRP